MRTGSRSIQGDLDVDAAGFQCALATSTACGGGSALSFGLLADCTFIAPARFSSELFVRTHQVSRNCAIARYRIATTNEPVAIRYMAERAALTTRPSACSTRSAVFTVARDVAVGYRANPSSTQIGTLPAAAQLIEVDGSVCSRSVSYTLKRMP